MLTNQEEFRIVCNEIYKQSPIGTEIYDKDGYLLAVNQAVVRLFGLENENSPKGYYLFDNPFVDKAILDKLKAGSPVKTVIKVDFDLVRQKNIFKTTRTGNMLLSVHATPVYDEHKKELLGYISHLTDISEQERLKEDLAVKAEVNMSLFSKLGFLYLYCTYDPYNMNLAETLKAVEVNDVFESYYKIEGNNAVQRKFVDIFPWITDSELWETLQADVIKDRKNLDYEFYSEDSKRWLKSFFYSPHPGHLFVLTRDISEEKIFLGTILNKVEDLYQVLKPALHKKSQVEDPLAVYEQLTEKEKKIVLLVLKGYNNKAIAKEMFCAEPTAKKHISDIYKKLNICKRFELIQMFKDYIFDV